MTTSLLNTDTGGAVKFGNTTWIPLDPLLWIDGTRLRKTAKWERLDHGTSATSAAFVASNEQKWYLCGTKKLQGKVECLEESIRVPMIMSGGVVKASGGMDTPVASIDLPATFLDYAGVRPAQPLSGRSLRPQIETGKSKREVVFSSRNDGRPEALMVPRAVEPYRVARTRTHKLIVWESGKQICSSSCARIRPGRRIWPARPPMGRPLSKCASTW